MPKTAEAKADPHRNRVPERSIAIQQEFLTILTVWSILGDQLKPASRVCQGMALITRPENKPARSSVARLRCQELNSKISG